MLDLDTLKEFYPNKTRGRANIIASSMKRIKELNNWSNKRLGKELGVTGSTVYRIIYYWENSSQKLKEWIDENDFGVHKAHMLAKIETAGLDGEIPSWIWDSCKLVKSPFESGYRRLGYAGPYPPWLFWLFELAYDREKGYFFLD